MGMLTWLKQRLAPECDRLLLVNPAPIKLDHSTHRMPHTLPLQVTANSMSMLTWLMQRLIPERDRLLLVRTKGFEADGSESKQTTRLMSAFANEASTKG